MDKQSHVSPLAPAGIYGKSDEEFATVKPSNRHKKSSKCLVYVLTALVIMVAVFLIIGLAFLRVESPRVRLNSVTIKTLQYFNGTNSFNSTASNSTLSSYVNVTMVAQVSVENENYGSYKFVGARAVLLYGNATIGGGQIIAGRARARKTERMDVIMEVRSQDHLGKQHNNTDFTSDLNKGLLDVRSYAKFSGRVRIGKIVNRHRNAELNCTMSLNLTGKFMQVLRCN